MATKYLTVKEAAAELGISERGVQKLLEYGSLKGKRPHGWLVDAASVEARKSGK